MNRHLVLASLSSALVFTACDGPTPSRDAGVDAGKADAGPDAGEPVTLKGPAVILMIGDGMGRGQLEAASRFRHGEPGKLFMQNLPAVGEVTTGSLSGLTDSAAAATTLATGERTYNARVGLDRNNQPLETLVELAHKRGQRAGIVSTASIPHATPGSFSAHRVSREEYVDIAYDQAMTVRPDVMLGGGLKYFLPPGSDSARTDRGLIDPLKQAGFRVVRNAKELAAVPGTEDVKVFGAFAPDHMDYVKDRAPTSPQPTLTDMSLAALRLLERSENGFFLMIEGARIDMASHLNDHERAIGETLAFDDAIAAVAKWAEDKEGVTLVVTADHECGGLVPQPAPKGVLPTVAWRWGNHTNDRVSVFGKGEGVDAFHGKLTDHREIHALLKAKLTKSAVVPPARALIPDGNLKELRYEASRQANTSAFGPGLNQLDALRVDADEHGLGIGVEGLFEWDRNAIVILVDVDYGMGTGPAKLSGALTDTTGKLDGILSALMLDAPTSSGFGADLAVASFGGIEARSEDLLDNSGLRGLRAPYGKATDLGWLHVAANFGLNVRTREARAVVPFEGYEVFIPWGDLYPGLNGKVPASAQVALAVVLVNDDGGYTSNQLLPPLAPSTTMNPGRTLTRLPGIVRFHVDADGDGTADGAEAPALLP